MYCRYKSCIGLFSRQRIQVTRLLYELQDNKVGVGNACSHGDYPPYIDCVIDDIYTEFDDRNVCVTTSNVNARPVTVIKDFYQA
jgi:hypothetical protein